MLQKPLNDLPEYNLGQIQAALDIRRWLGQYFEAEHPTPATALPLPSERQVVYGEIALLTALRKFVDKRLAEAPL